MKRAAPSHLYTSFPHGESNLKRILLFVLTNVMVVAVLGVVASLLGVNKGAIPPVLNCDEPDPECDLDLILSEPRATDNPTFLTTNLTRHGQAAALVVRGGAGVD